ncbi:ubiquinone biosynthesis accessory factor UbiJ [Oceanisphaera sp. KMM 10153]|uniref:ubiquinone biosynthesis accessory factor UbiJ n=1 Tax=Oceanisphaera submarina TaxID=3390193 RepID=UPI0039770E50
MKTLLFPLLNGSLEAAFNRFMQHDSERLKKVAPLQGKVLQLTVTDVAGLYLLFSADRLEILRYYEGAVDSHLSLSLNALGLLKDKGLLMQYIRDGRIDLQGDPQPWQDFSALVKDPNIDLEALLAPYTGDIMAHLLCRHGREFRTAVERRTLGIRDLLGDYVREEARLAVSPLELADFNDEVNELNKRLLQLQARLATLTDKVVHS